MCGVFGIVGHPEASNLTYLGLHALQHRGQESAGIVSADGTALHAHRQMGLVADIFSAPVLEKLPGYTFFRGLTSRLAGRSEGHKLEPALVEIEEALVPALIVEKLDDGWFTVLVPSAPTPMAGSIYILPPDRVHPVDLPLTTAISVFSKWGTGAGEFVKAMKDASATPTAVGLSQIRS